jgi:hypothetical protein
MAYSPYAHQYRDEDDNERRKDNNRADYIISKILVRSGQTQVVIARANVKRPKTMPNDWPSLQIVGRRERKYVGRTHTIEATVDKLLTIAIVSVNSPASVNRLLGTIVRSPEHIRSGTPDRDTFLVIAPSNSPACTAAAVTARIR